MKRNRIALFDLDGTLADYDGQLLKDLQRIASPHEPPPLLYQDIPYIEARRHVITSQCGWFRNLPKFKLGWDVLEIAKEIGYSISILTKAPYRKHAAWSEKVEWCAEHLEDYYIDGVTIAHDKGMVYGALLVDDWPEYIESWLKYRPRGLVIMPANDHNAGFNHPNVVRYDGSNLVEVRTRMTTRFNEP
jgi:5'(3')-deoxyribonucleotidase